jgi:hypothetical protein
MFHVLSKYVYAVDSIDVEAFARLEILSLSLITVRTVVRLTAEAFPILGGGSSFSWLLTTCTHISKLAEHFNEEKGSLCLILLFSATLSAF